jgi:hypothetical protein
VILEATHAVIIRDKTEKGYRYSGKATDFSPKNWYYSRRSKAINRREIHGV